MASFRTELLGLVALLALVPVVAYLLGRSAAVVLSVVCVLVIAWSVYRMLGPAEVAPTH